jgi:putative salt-induced outer membrane protein YdiY
LISAISKSTAVVIINQTGICIAVSSAISASLLTITGSAVGVNTSTWVASESVSPRREIVFTVSRGNPTSASALRNVKMAW